VDDNARVQTGLNPGFEAVPWVARNEMGPRGIGLHTPRHLMTLTFDERDASLYPRAHPGCFCWACGRPTRADGFTGARHRGVGKPCPACGYRRKRTQTREHKERSRELARNLAQYRDPVAHVAERRSRMKVVGVGQMMREVAVREAETVLRPYFQGLALEPKDGWSPSTALDFYNTQTMIAERLLDRVEGKPVQRSRHVDGNGDDVLGDDSISPQVLVRVVAALATGADVDVLLAPEDAEWSALADGS